MDTRAGFVEVKSVVRTHSSLSRMVTLLGLSGDGYPAGGEKLG